MRLLLTLLLTAGIQAAMAQQDVSPHSPAQNRESGVPSSQNMSGMDMSARQSQDRHMPMSSPAEAFLMSESSYADATGWPMAVDVDGTGLPG